MTQVLTGTWNLERKIISKDGEACFTQDESCVSYLNKNVAECVTVTETPRMTHTSVCPSQFTIQLYVQV